MKILTKTFATACVVGLAAFLLGPEPAHAAHWAVTYETSGTDHGYMLCWEQHNMDGMPNEKDNSWPSTDLHSSITHSVFDEGNSDAYNQSMSAVTGGSVTPVFTWTPDNESDMTLPPKHLYAREDFSVCAMDTTGHGPVGTTKISHSIPAPDESDGNYKYSQGSRLVSQDNAGQNTVVRLDGRSFNAESSTSIQVDGWEAEAQISYSIQPINVKLIRDFSDVTDNPQDVKAGQRMRLSAIVEGADGYPVSDYQWTIPDNKIYDWVGGVTTGFVMADVTTDQPSTNFCWVDSGTKEVSFTVNVGELSCVAEATFAVERPSADLNVALTGTVALDDNYGAVEGNDLTPVALHYGTGYSPERNKGPVGVVMTNSPAAPDDTYHLLQLVSNSVRRYKQDGNWFRLFPSDGLDSNPGNVCWYPYQDIASTQTSDSPGVGINDSISDITVDDSFSLWLMYKPYTGDDPYNAVATWVPLKTVNWGWSGSAVRQGTSWASTDLVSGSPSGGGAGTDTTTYPTWNQPIHSADSGSVPD